MIKAEDIGYIQEYTIRSNEIDSHKRATAPALVQLMQDASVYNAMKLKVSVWDLASQNLSWVLIRKEIKFHQYPKLGDKITVLTYPSGFDRVLAYRDFIIYNQQKEVIADSSSTWVLMNTLTRKMVKIPEEEFKIPLPEDITLLPHPSAKIPELENSSFESEFKVNWFDLDWNDHVNNIFLIKSILEGVPKEFLVNKRVNKILIHFKNESLWKDELTSHFQLYTENRTLHKLIRKADGKEIVRAEVSWEDQV